MIGYRLSNPPVIRILNPSHWNLSAKVVILSGSFLKMDDIPLADDESHPNALDKVKNAKPALPLPEQEDQEEKARLISQVLELQNTLQDLSRRVEMVREESMKLRSENMVLGKYIKNLMTSTPLFQPTNANKDQQPSK